MTKKLGFGVMRLPLVNPDDYSSIDIEAFKLMADYFISHGFSYFDTGYSYHNGNSESAFREAVVKRHRRNTFTITDKMPSWLLTQKADLQRIFEEQLIRCGVEYFDYYWLHSLNKEYYTTIENLDGFGFLLKMKRDGKVGHIGFSFHGDSILLEQILKEHPETEYVQLQLNYLDWESPAIDSKRCYEVATKYGKPVIVMEPIKGGSLARIPVEAERLFKEYNNDYSPSSWALRFATSLDNVFMVLSGMSEMSQVEENIKLMGKLRPVGIEEMKLFSKAAKIINNSISIPCTACHYCTEGCPVHICIPEYFEIYNFQKRFGKSKTVMDNSCVYYQSLSNTHGKASDCISCGQCEEHCPQHISIKENLKLVAKEFE